VMRQTLWLALTAFTFSAPSFGVCDPKVVQGTYGFQLSGDARVSGDLKPAVTVGRVTFDGAAGVSGVSSVNFAGYLLGNPVNGTYETRPDCTISWSFQDDSGNQQHFAG